mgnify:FL=1
MKKKLKTHDIDFETFLENALKSHGYMFPETDEQLAVFEENMECRAVPEELDLPDLEYKSGNEGKYYCKKSTPEIDPENEKNWAIAAREGKDLTREVLDQMKRDRDKQRAGSGGNKES